MKTIQKIVNEIKYIAKRLSVIALSLWCFYLIYVWYTFGFWWFFSGFILTGGVLFVAMRHHMMLAIRTIEMSLWGKPLDKAYWKDDKPGRLKFVWKRDRSEDEEKFK